VSAVSPKSSTPAPLEYPGLELVAPLRGLSRAEVQEAIRHLNVELPDHYAAYPSSLDCSVCPSSLTTRRRAWMAQRYPEHLAAAEKPFMPRFADRLPLQHSTRTTPRTPTRPNKRRGGWGIDVDNTRLGRRAV
jgi:3'-phosphoadenosine 5'-phosphosulfate sulfotransferase (PAPS reductase)/FAD synthetase